MKETIKSKNKMINGQLISEFLGIKVTQGNPLNLYHNNELVYCENSTGFWYKYEYDKNGKEVYCENSTGGIIDNRPKKQTELTLDEIATKFGISVDQLKIKK